jgi:hypothetical protein
VCTECIQGAVSDGIDTIKCAQPGCELSVEHVNVAALVCEGGEDPTKNVEAESPQSSAPAPSPAQNPTPPAAESDPAHADRAAQVAKAEADMAIEEAEVKLQERRQALNARKAQLAAGPDDQVFPWAGADSK